MKLNRPGKLALLIVFSLLLLLSGATPGYAQVGVGVSIAKIVVDDPVSPGEIYRLPSVGVMNTGQEAGEYEVAVFYHHEQKELRPPQDWFAFKPETFHLEPGESQSVAITLSIPVNAKPGDYFAYIEAHPISKETGVVIGIAAATKLYFTVKPANVFAGVVARVSAFFETTAPGSYIGLGILAVIVVILVSRRYFRVRFRVERRQ